MVPKDFIHTDNLYPVFPKRPRLEIFTAKYVKQRKTNLQRKQSLWFSLENAFLAKQQRFVDRWSIEGEVDRGTLLSPASLFLNPEQVLKVGKEVRQHSRNSSENSGKCDSNSTFSCDSQATGWLERMLLTNFSGKAVSRDRHGLPLLSWFFWNFISNQHNELTGHKNEKWVSISHRIFIFIHASFARQDRKWLAVWVTGSQDSRLSGECRINWDESSAPSMVRSWIRLFIPSSPAWDLSASTRNNHV